jgi:hypothetical protein
MGIFDYFSGQDAQNAADAQKAGIQQGYNNLTPFFGQGRDALTSSLGTGTNALTGALGSAVNDYTSGLTGATGAYNTGLSNATGALGTSLANSTAPFQTNLNVGQAGQGAYADATGANGPAGNARAVQNFQTGPGYQFNLQQQFENLMRAQNASGQANSGATNVDALTQASGLANQGWQSYINNLQPFIGSSNAAATGIAGANQNYGNTLTGANLATAGGLSGANLNTASGLAGSNVNVGQLLAALNQGTGSQLNQSLQGQGNAAYGAATGIGNAQANADLADYTASGNIWNTALGFANAAAKAAGGGKG